MYVLFLIPDDIFYDYKYKISTSLPNIPTIDDVYKIIVPLACSMFPQEPITKTKIEA